MVEVKTILNENLVRKFNTDQAKTKVWFVVLLASVFVALGSICMAAGFLETLYGVLLILLGLALPAIYFLTVRILMNKMIKSSPVLKSGTTQLWRFLDNEIIFNESGKYAEARDTRFSYGMIHKAVENETAFYIYVNKMQAYIIDAKGFSIGSRRDLHDLLINKLGNKKFRYAKRLYAKR